MPTKDEQLTEFPSIVRLGFGHERQLSRQFQQERGWEKIRLCVSEKAWAY